MAYTFRVYAPNTTGATIDTSANPPAAGEVLLVWSVSDSTSTSGTGPGTGWTQINAAWQVTTTDAQSLAVWIKNTAAAGGETSIDCTTSTVNLNGAMAIGGVDATTFQDVTAPAPANNNTGVASVGTITNSITPTTNGSLIVAIKGTDTLSNVDVTHTFSGGGLTWTTRADQYDSSFRNVGVGTAEQTTAAAITVTGSSTYSTGNAGQAMYVMALRNASPPAGGSIDRDQIRLSGGMRDLTGGTS